MNNNEYHHPFSYGIVNTTFYTKNDALLAIKEIDAKLGKELSKTDQTVVNVLRGTINWLVAQGQSEEISQAISFMAADDAVGQCNKLFPFGLTGSLCVKYKRPIKSNSASQIFVKVLGRETISKAEPGGYVRHKTFCKLKICSDLNKKQVVAKAVFIETTTYLPQLPYKWKKGKMSMRLSVYSHIRR